MRIRDGFLHGDESLLRAARDVGRKRGPDVCRAEGAQAASKKKKKKGKRGKGRRERERGRGRRKTRRNSSTWSIRGGVCPRPGVAARLHLKNTRTCKLNEIRGSTWGVFCGKVVATSSSPPRQFKALQEWQIPTFLRIRAMMWRRLMRRGQCKNPMQRKPRTQQLHSTRSCPWYQVFQSSTGGWAGSWAVAPQCGSIPRWEYAQQKEESTSLTIETEKVYDAQGGAHVTTRVKVAEMQGTAWMEGDPWTQSEMANSAAGSPDTASPLALVAAEEKAAAAARSLVSPRAAADAGCATMKTLDVRQTEPVLEPPKWMPRVTTAIKDIAGENPLRHPACERISLAYLGLHRIDLSPKLRCSLVSLDLSGMPDGRSLCAMTSANAAGCATRPRVLYSALGAPTVR